MKIWALVSFYDERPEDLTVLAESLAPLCDGIVAVDGAYALYPNGKGASPAGGTVALKAACIQAGLDLVLHQPAEPWEGNEVHKRAAMFDLALQHATSDDWLLIMDGDMTVWAGSDTAAVRDALRTTDCDVAEVEFGELAYGSIDTTIHVFPFRSLFRALPGLTVEGTHWMYVIPRPDGSRRFMWHSPDPKVDLREPALDVSGHLRLLHAPHKRTKARTQGRAGYYEAREQRNVERTPTYAQLED